MQHRAEKRSMLAIAKWAMWHSVSRAALPDSQTHPVL